MLAKITAEDFCVCNALYCEDTTKGYFDQEFGKNVSWDIPLLQGYRYSFLPNSGLSRLGGFFRLSNLSVRKHLGKRDTDILVVHGWDYFTALFAIVVAKARGIQVWLRAENPYNQEIRKSWYIRAAKKILLQWVLFKLVDRFLYIGTENRLFYTYYGVTENKLVFCPYCVDNERLQRPSPSFNSKEAAKVSLGLSAGDFVVLFSGKLISKKRPMDLAKAFYKASVENGKLILLGDGDLIMELRGFIAEYAIDNIILAGFKNQTELAAYYCAADLFVLPSGMGETWGLVVNEAMNYSLPLIVSDLVGSSADLVKEAQNGYVFEVGNINQLAALLKKAASDACWLTQAGKQSFALIQEYSYNTIVRDIKSVLQQ